MNTMIPITAGISLLITTHLFGDNFYLYQEPLGTPLTYVAPVATYQYLGIRFEVSQPARIVSLQSVMSELQYSMSPSSYFAALVHLPTVTSLPQGNPFAAGEVIHSTVFSLHVLPYVWVPLDLSFDVTVDPGAYAVVFGSGLLGSAGPIDGILPVYNRVSDSTGFGWLDSGGASSWYDNTKYSWDISVVAAPIPEPSTATLTVIGLLGSALLMREKKAQQAGCSEPRNGASVSSREPAARGR